MDDIVQSFNETESASSWFHGNIMHTIALYERNLYAMYTRKSLNNNKIAGEEMDNLNCLYALH